MRKQFTLATLPLFSWQWSTNNVFLKWNSWMKWIPGMEGIQWSLVLRMYNGKRLAPSHTAIASQKPRKQVFPLPWVVVNSFSAGSLSSSLPLSAIRLDVDAADALGHLVTLGVLDSYLHLWLKCLVLIPRSKRVLCTPVFLPSVCCSLMGSTRSGLHLRIASLGANLIK